MERWFRTVRLQRLPTLLEVDTRSLDALNQRLWTWIEDEYQMDAEPRSCLLLLGQTELRRRLTMAVHEALAQRIVVRYRRA